MPEYQAESLVANCPDVIGIAGVLGDKLIDVSGIPGVLGDKFILLNVF